MAQCVTQVQLQISCRNLQNKDVLSKSDPLVVVMMQEGNGKWFEHARTESVKNNLNPSFCKEIAVDYYFEMVQKLKFVVYDVDNESQVMDDDDFLGEMECTLGQVVSKKSFTKELDQHKGKKVGSITVDAEEKSGQEGIVKLTFTAKNLDKKDLLGKSDPFLEISKMKSDGTCILVHKTEVIGKNLNPSWKPFETTLHSLCGGDYNAVIKIEVYDYDFCSDNDLIGIAITTLQELLDAKSHWKCLELINPKKQKKETYVNSGELYVNECEIIPVYTFLEYVMGGCQINFSVGVDFTLSNLEPDNPDSLHYMNPNKPNEYIEALLAVGQVCQDYDTDKLFPAYGFGAIVPPSSKTSHAFPLNFNPDNPYCEGISGVVAAYQACLPKIELSLPTNAAPIINLVAENAMEAKRKGDASQYFVLLMLTDGALSDMEDTKAAIIRASRLPMSIIIVGVGTANFSKMNELDADDGLLQAFGKTADRDIVQFVPFEQFKHSPAVLAQHVLAEVPKQVQEYFNQRKIAPLNPKSAAN